MHRQLDLGSGHPGHSLCGAHFGLDCRLQIVARMARVEYLSCDNAPAWWALAGRRARRTSRARAELVDLFRQIGDWREICSTKADSPSADLHSGT